MKPSDLITVWAAPDNTRLTAKQYTIRLPIRVAAQIAALEEMYPGKNRTEIVGDLLSTALDELREGLPYTETDEIVGIDAGGRPEMNILGPRADFHRLTDMFMKELETELGQEESLPVAASAAISKLKEQKSKKGRRS